MDEQTKQTIKPIIAEDVINDFGNATYERIDSCKSKFTDLVLEYAEGLGMDIKAVLIKYGLAHENVLDYVKEGFDEIIDDAHQTMEVERRKMTDALEAAKIELAEIKETNLDPTQVEARITKIRLGFEYSFSFVDYSFVEYDVKNFKRKFYNKFDINDFNVEREINHKLNDFSDEVMVKYYDSMKNLQNESSYEFGKACENLKVSMNQEQTITQAMAHPEELTEETIILYAQGKSQQELEQSYRDAKRRIMDDPNMSEEERKRQLMNLDVAYAVVLENGLPLDNNVQLEDVQSVEQGMGPKL